MTDGAGGEVLILVISQWTAQRTCYVEIVAYMLCYSYKGWVLAKWMSLPIKSRGVLCSVVFYQLKVCIY